MTNSIFHNLACAGVLTLALLPGRSHADIIYVNADAGDGDGLSWESPFSDLQDALALAEPGDEIWVVAGLYLPSTNDATASFVLPDAVGVYGGFLGNETQRGQRDWANNQTILSGDIGQDDVVSPWPSGWLINTSNVGHVVKASGVSALTVLDGFTIENGHTGPAGTPAGHELMFGSGVYIVEGSPRIRNCHFRHNLAAFAMGGGLYCWDGNPEVSSCVFEENYVHGGGGGGMFFGGTSAPDVHDCTFDTNIAVATSVSNLQGDGAGMAHYGSEWIHVRDCRFEYNHARSFFSIGDAIGYGGGLWIWNGGATVERCTFVGNKANLGGGAMSWGPSAYINCVFRQNQAIPQPNDPYPEQGGDGAGIAAWSFSPDAVDVINCTVVANTGKKYVGLSGFVDAVFNVSNSIIRDNAGTHEETMGTWKEQLNGFGDIASSNIAHIFEPHGEGEDPIDPEDLPGVIDADPLFAGPPSDLHLGPGSPCIDAANNTLVPGGVTIDLDGHARFFDDPATPDTGVGSAPIVDMGAYEYGSGVLPGDLNNDGAVNVSDLLQLLAAWGSCEGCPEDLTGDGIVGVDDLLFLLQSWSG